MRRRKLYGRRKGPKLSAHQRKLFETLLPRLNVHLCPGADLKSRFGVDVDDVWLEIGFGAGEHFLWQAEHHPRIGIIGAEPYESGVAKLLSKLAPLCPGQREGGIARNPPLPDPFPRSGRGEVLERMRIYPGDGRELMDMIPYGSIGRVFLLFPDPWPKRRHHKRRFIQSETLSLLARAMKEGAELRFASDDPHYVAWTLERVLAHDAFVWIAEGPHDWLARPDDWPATRYEQKALRGAPAFLRFVRRRKLEVADLQSGVPRRK